MKTSFEKSLSGALGRARLGYVLKPQELVTSVAPQSHFAKRPTLAFRLSSAEFNEVGWGMQSCATGRLRFDDVLFALLVTGTKSHIHLGVMNMSDPASLAAVLQCAKSGAINIGVTNAHGDHRLSSLDVDDPFAVAIEQSAGIREQVSRAQLFQAFEALTRAATRGGLIRDLGIPVRKERAVAHLLLPLADDLLTATSDAASDAGKTTH